jgi:hypothetical protein
MFLLGGIVHLQENVDMSLNGDLRKAEVISITSAQECSSRNTNDQEKGRSQTCLGGSRVRSG